jgi:signal transduction histidine kinase
MGETEITIFIVIANFILLIFIGGIIVFIFQYRKRKLAHEQEKEQINLIHRQEILTQQIDTQTQTMKDIGQEIHDNVGQKLTLAAIYTQQLEHANNYPELKESFENISKIINDSISDLRQLSKSLVNPDSIKIDLLEMIKNEANQINQSGFLRMKIDTDFSKIPLETKMKNSIFRIFQEFTQNSLKHANCKNILINILKTEQGVVIKMIDDGNGFTIHEKNNGIGLSNMKRRAKEMDIDFEFTSKINEGTQLILTVNI